MIGESDRYNPERAKQMRADLDAWSEWTTMDPYSMPMPPAIGSSSVPFEGDVEHLLKFCNQTVEHCTDENWDGSHVAVNAKSDGEAEVHGTRGRVRLVVATETTRDDCVALLMHPMSFRKIYGSMQSYSQRLLAYMKMGHELLEIDRQSSNLDFEIEDLEEHLRKSETSGPATVATLRCQERLRELRVRVEDANRRVSELEKSRERESNRITTIQGQVFEEFQNVFEGANLLPDLNAPAHSYIKSQPSPFVEGPISHRYEEMPLQPTAGPSCKSSEGVIKDDTQYPSLSIAALRVSSEHSSVDAEASQSTEQQKRGSTVNSDFQDNK